MSIPACLHRIGLDGNLHVRVGPASRRKLPKLTHDVDIRHPAEGFDSHDSDASAVSNVV